MEERLLDVVWCKWRK